MRLGRENGIDPYCNSRLPLASSNKKETETESTTKRKCSEDDINDTKKLQKINPNQLRPTTYYPEYDALKKLIKLLELKEYRTKREIIVTLLSKFSKA